MNSVETENVRPAPVNGDHSHQVPRAAAVVALGGVALIHVLELQTKLKEVPYIGVGYIFLVVSCVIAAAMLVHRNSRLGWMIAGGVALATLIGFSLTRTVGLPQSKDDIGNWLEPMGLAALFIEACVVMLAGYGLGINRLTNANRTGQISVRSTF